MQQYTYPDPGMVIALSIIVSFVMWLSVFLYTTFALPWVEMMDERRRVRSMQALRAQDELKANPANLLRPAGLTKLADNDVQRIAETVNNWRV